MNAQFTPGPWMRDGISVTEELPVGKERPCIALAHPQTHLSPGKSCERMKANARLIAAAPELYEHAEAAVRGIEEAVRILDLMGRGGDARNLAVHANNLRNPLRKARGEQ